MHFSTTSLLLAAAGAAFGAPAMAGLAVEKRDSSTEPNENDATCTFDKQFMHGKWTLQVGRPYEDGQGCPSVKDTLEKHMTVWPVWECYQGTGNVTTIEFSTPHHTDEQNGALQDAYPMVPFVENHICPDYSDSD